MLLKHVLHKFGDAKDFTGDVAAVASVHHKIVVEDPLVPVYSNTQGIVLELHHVATSNVEQGRLPENNPVNPLS